MPIPIDEWTPPIARARPPYPPRKRHEFRHNPLMLDPSFRIDPPSRQQLFPDPNDQTVKSLAAAATRFYTAQSAPPVLFRGDANATLLVIGEAPGSVECRTGLPFTGPSENLLEDLLNQAASQLAIPRPLIFFTNTSFWTSEGNPDPTVHRAEAARPVLLALFEILPPSAILTTGAAATHAITATKLGISNLRGQTLVPDQPWSDALRTPPPQVVPTWHPAFILRRHRPKNMIDDSISDIIIAMRHASHADHSANLAYTSRICVNTF